MWTIPWLLLLTVAFQNRPAQSSARSSISGVVIRAGAAAGTQYIAGAVVELRPASMFVTTDGLGRFVFRNVATGHYTLIPRKEGLVPQKDAARGLSDLGKMLKAETSQTITNVELPMIAAPAISGFVFHPNGEPLAAAVVQAHARRHTPFGPQLKIVRRVITNDTGEYRLYWLPYGEYLVSAGYGERILNSALAGVRLSANVSKPDDGYTTVYYGNTTNPGQAQAARVAPGLDAGGVNIVLSDVPRRRVQGQFVPSPPDIQIAFVPAGSDITVSADYSVQARAGGGFEIKGVSPGAYVMLASGSGMSSDLVRISVGNEDVENLKIPLYPMVTINGSVEFPGRVPDANARVRLVRRTIEVDHTIEAPVEPKGSFSIKSGAGEFDVFMESLSASEYVRSIRFGGMDALLLGIRVSGDPPGELEIGVGTASANVEGRVLGNNGRPSGGAQVVLVPEPKYRYRTDRYWTGFTDGEGNFNLSSIPPGEYTAYAFEQIAPGDHFAFAYSGQAHSRFADRAVRATVKDSGTTTVRLRAIPAEESAGAFQ